VGLRAISRLEHGALGDDALCDIAPQGDEGFAGQRHECDAADASLAGTDPRLKPAAQHRVRLLAQLSSIMVCRRRRLPDLEIR
jgi:hypothetical protein